MNYKIVTTNSKRPDVLLYRDRDETGQEMVTIFAIGENKTEQSDDYFASEIVRFEGIEMARQFIDMFDDKAAIKWCENEGITYLY